MHHRRERVLLRPVSVLEEVVLAQQNVAAQVGTFRLDAAPLQALGLLGLQVVPPQIMSTLAPLR